MTEKPMSNEPVVDATRKKGRKQVLEPEQWVDRYADYLFNYALIRLNDEELARDLVQDTFLSALEKTDTFRGESTERTWLNAILKYKVIDIYRKRSNRLSPENNAAGGDKEKDLFDPDLHNWKREHWPVPFSVEEPNALHHKEFMQVLQRCMKKLPPLWLSVFTMKHMDDEVAENICKDLRITSSNFWVVMHRAKVSLRACLQKNWI
jgi:RNA polymerase sigma-70 factor (ECF subfamily)